jgi:hypothetical protein
MREQLIAPVEPGSASHRRLDPVGLTALATRQSTHEPHGPHAVNAVDHLLVLIETSRDGRLDGSLLDLAVAASCDVETARRAVASLDPVDHLVSVDIQRAPAEERWVLTWAPVTGIVDLMLDWDLLTLEITIVELSEWLGVIPDITCRALDWLTRTPGVRVAHEGTGDGATVHVDVALERCPLTAEARPSAG